MNRRNFMAAALAAAAAPALPRFGDPSASPRLILYLSGGVNEAMVNALGPSRFNILILAFVYVRYRGGKLTITHNGIAPARAKIAYSARLRRLRDGFHRPKRIMISLGGWGNSPTFAAIQAAGVERFLDALDREIIAPLGIEGIDLDLEPSTVAENTPAGWRAVHNTYGATLVELTRGYRRRHPSHVVTHAPIASVAAALYARDSHLTGVNGSLLDACGSALSWLNVQFYEAGDPSFGLAPGVRPLSIPEFCRRELGAIPIRKIVPGFEPRYHQDLAFAESTLAALPGIGGAFLWDYRQIAASAAGVEAWGAGLAARVR